MLRAARFPLRDSMLDAGTRLTTHDSRFPIPDSRFTMPSYNAQWIRRHAGPTTPRRMSAILRRIAAAQGQPAGARASRGAPVTQARSTAPASAELAVTRVARRRDPFAVLVACLISLRTKDEVTDVAAPRLLAVAPDARRLAQLSEARIARLIYPAGFYRTKARTLRALARTLLERNAGSVPDTLDGLLALNGVGRKTANLVVTLGFQQPGICVDTHVHRIARRTGFVTSRAPDDTEQVLRARLPRRWWIPINDLLVTHGRTVCTPLSPRCSRCAAARLCPRAGVERAR